MAFESNAGMSSARWTDESISSFSVEDISTTIHRTRSQRIAFLPLRYRDNDNRSVSSSTHSMLYQLNPEMSPRIRDKVSVSALHCVCNICQASTTGNQVVFIHLAIISSTYRAADLNWGKLSQLAYLFGTVSVVPLMETIQFLSSVWTKNLLLIWGVHWQSTKISKNSAQNS